MDHGSIRLHDDECCREAYACILTWQALLSPATIVRRWQRSWRLQPLHIVARLPHHHGGR